MATALYGVILTQPGNVEQIKAYLYAATEIVETRMVNPEYRPGGPDLCFLVLRTEAITENEARNAQQYQADRLASGMHGMTIGFGTRYLAQKHVEERALANEWGLLKAYPGSALVSATE